MFTIIIYTITVIVLIIAMVRKWKEKKLLDEWRKAEEEERQQQLELLDAELVNLEISRQRKRQTGDLLEKLYNEETDNKKKIVLLNKMDTIDTQLFKLDKKIKTLEDEIAEL